MTTNTNADLIAEAREAAKRADWYMTGESPLLRALADALEAAEQEKAEAWRVAGEQTRLERDRAEAAEKRAEEAERRLKDMRHLASIYGKGWDEERAAGLAAVVEKVREAIRHGSRMDAHPTRMPTDSVQDSELWWASWHARADEAWRQNLTEAIATAPADALREVKAEAISDVTKISRQSRGFWSRVVVEDPEGCWLWTGARRGAHEAYGGYSGTTAHRYSWALHNGGWPESGVVVRHRCDTPLCVNPDHLELGTQAENVADMIERGRASWQAAECRNGHVRTEANTYVRPSGKRECLDCRTEWKAKKGVPKSKIKKCPECGREFQSRNLARHRRSVHGVIPGAAGHPRKEQP